jgi:hypothetical protein
MKSYLFIVVLLVTLSGLTGCVPRLEVLQSPVATPVPVATVAPEKHALAILGVDFDPSLNVAEMLSNGGVTLLVAVQNRGLETESNVRVTARLVDASGSLQELLVETVVLYALAPDEVRVVRFTQVSNLPRRESYTLLVHVEPVQGESVTADNLRSFNIVVHP